MSRFLGRLWRLVHGAAPRLAPPAMPPSSERPGDRELHRLTHHTIRRVTDDVVERLHFNTAIAAVMELVTAAIGAAEAAHPATLREAVDTILLLLAPFVPHVASELWEASGHTDALAEVPWPVADPAALLQATIELPVQINGKVRDRVVVSAEATEEQIKAAALASETVQRHLEGKEPKKVIVANRRLVSIVV